MTSRSLAVPTLLVALCLLAGCAGCRDEADQPGAVQDEAMAAGRAADSFRGADEDYFRDMDYGLSRDPAAVAAELAPYLGPDVDPLVAAQAFARGRNNWIVWTAGNDRFWDEISRLSFGALDLLKTVSSYCDVENHGNDPLACREAQVQRYEAWERRYGGYEGYGGYGAEQAGGDGARWLYGRHNRWRYLGLVNEPCFERWEPPAGCDPAKDRWGCGDPERYGLWLDRRDPSCPADPFENADKYPGVETGARGDNLPVGSYYGWASGIVGLRLFPNPDFDRAAADRWDPYRYYNDSGYYNDRRLVKPYRVGMSCGFCHVGPNPSRPPADPESPAWENLASNPGAQYFWIDRIFFWDLDEQNYVYQMFHTSRPGALDTSLVSPDSINNPRTMNAVYNLGARLEIARHWGRETLAGGELDNKQLNDYVPGGPLTEFFAAPDTVWTPRVLKDGADSVGALGALNRVFVNIGLFSEEWLLHFRPLVGIKEISPFEIAVAERNSSYWKATEAQTPDTALFFLASARPDKLADAPGGAAHLADDPALLDRGRRVFGERCARCHSSKLPEEAFAFFPEEGCAGPGYLDCWNGYWQWTKSDAARAAFREVTAAGDFLEDNFLSTDLRVPVTLLETNACSPLATNAIADDIWDNFSSSSYKSLPAVGTILVHHPLSGEAREFEMPGGGRGYTRPASLVSLWSTAPYLLNNTVGDFYWTGGVDDRMRSFEDGITKILWPERRAGDREYLTVSGKTAPGVIDRTTTSSYLKIAHGFLPDYAQKFLGFQRWLPWVDAGDMVLELGPIPAGTPVNLIANLQFLPDKTASAADKAAHRERVRKLVLKMAADLIRLGKNASDERAREVFGDLVEPLLAVNKCPDFVVNRGHYFGTDYLPASEGEPGLADDEKLALIEFLKRF